MGANDSFKLNTPGIWRNNVSELIRTLQTKFPNTPIVFANMPPIKEFPAFTPLIKFVIGNLSEILREELIRTVSKFDNVFFYSRKITFKSWKERLNIQADESEFFSDGVHPSKLTYQVWAKDLCDFMVNDLNIRKLIVPKN